MFHTPNRLMLGGADEFSSLLLGYGATAHWPMDQASPAFSATPDTVEEDFGGSDGTADREAGAGVWTLRQSAIMNSDASTHSASVVISTSTPDLWLGAMGATAGGEVTYGCWFQMTTGLQTGRSTRNDILGSNTPIQIGGFHLPSGAGNTDDIELSRYHSVNPLYYTTIRHDYSQPSFYVLTVASSGLGSPNQYRYRHYINGIQVGTSTGSAGWLGNYILRVSTASTSPAETGKWQSFFFVPSALSNTQVLKLYNAGKL